MSTDWKEPTHPSPRAAKLGRIVLCVVGVLFLGVGGSFAYFNPNSQIAFTAVVLGIGIVLVWLGLALPPKIVAHFGFSLPWFLPGE